MAEADTYTMTSPNGPGEKLRRAREQAGIDAAEVSAWTKIHERHLSALERGDYASLPARPYVIGFARTYAHALGLDAEEIVREVREDLDSVDRGKPARPSHFSEIEDPSKIPSKRLAWVVGFITLAVIVGLALLWRSYLSPAAELPPVTEETMAAPELSPAGQVSPTAESAVSAASQPAGAQQPAAAATSGAQQPVGAAASPSSTPAAQLSPAAR